MRKLIINIISFFLINSGLIFLIEKRIFKYRSLKYEDKSIFPFLKKYYHSIDYFLVTVVYFRNYYSKMKDPKNKERFLLKHWIMVRVLNGLNTTLTGIVRAIFTEKKGKIFIIKHLNL